VTLKPLELLKPDVGCEGGQEHAPILEVALPELVEGFQLLELQSLQREVLG
jgi:hypothetical protein